jgi:ketosteroid isomerase-like protein
VNTMLSCFGLRAAAAALVVGTTPVHAQHEFHGPSGDSAAVAAVVTQYDSALTRGDSATALALLADDAVILESGGIETREEYRKHHLPADINASRARKSERSPVHVRIRGDVAWTTTTSTSQREVNGNTVTSSSAELMVLVRTTAGWKISAIHWSSRTRRP